MQAYRTPSESDRTPNEVVLTEGRVKLLHYAPISTRVYPVPLLIVYALINRYYILDLQPDRSVVRRYLERGIDVYTINWGDPRPEDRYDTIGDHVGIIGRIVDYLRNRHDVDQINLQGYCMGGTFSAIYSALHPDKVRSLIVQAAPIDFANANGILNIWSKNIDADKIVDAFGNVPSSFLNWTFLLLNPVRLLVDKYVKFYENADDVAYVENFLRMEKWIFDSPDLPGETYREFIKDLYQKNLLSRNELVVKGQGVDLRRIDMPLLNIVAEEDNLVTPESSKPLNNLVSSSEKKIIEFPSGHIGLSVSAKSHRELWPQVAEWITRHSELE
jgi:polyhydroxyalkanoate synthase